MTTEQGGAPSASAGGAPAPDPNAVDNAVAGVLIDQYGFLPLSVRFSAAAAARAVTESWTRSRPVPDAEILPADRKPVLGEPGIQSEWDEDTDAMRVDGIGWDLSWGCKLSLAYDHERGEHYVCVSTSDQDQRAGITTRRTTKEQIALFGQQLLNVFGEPDPRDAEIERLRTALTRYQKRLGDDLLCGGKLVERVRAALRVDNGGTCTRASMDGVVGDVGRLCDEVERLRGKLDNSCVVVGDLCKERDEATAELERIATFVGGSAAMPGSVRSAVEAEIGRRDAKHQRAWEQAITPLVGERDRLRRERDEAKVERDRLRLEVASARSIADGKRTVAEKLRGQVDELEAQRDQRQGLWQARYGELIGGALAVQQHLQRATDRLIHPSDQFDKDFSRSVVDELKAELDGERRLRAEICVERDNARQERDRLRQELDFIARQPQGSNPYWQQRSKRVEAERDRLRAELDLIGEQHAAGLVTLRTDFTAGVNGLLPKPAEPRRWVAGDAEPEIGTTVTWGMAGATWSHRDDGDWRSDVCDCDSCLSAAGLPWSALLDAAATSGGLVEVVTTDG